MKHRDTGVTYAAKIVDKAIYKGMRDIMLREVHVMRSLRHDNVIALNSALESPTSLILICQFASGGELYERVTDDSLYAFEEKQSRAMVRSILSGVNHLHSFGVVHRDLKPENVLLSDPTPNAKPMIADFGLARFITNPMERMSTICGSRQYLAPEMLKCERGEEISYDKALDVWGVGIIAFFIIFGIHPFTQEPHVSVEAASMSGRLSFPRYHSAGGEARDFVKRMLSVRPIQRLTIEAAMRHPWVIESKSEQAAPTASRMAATDPIEPNVRPARRAIPLAPVPPTIPLDLMCHRASGNAFNRGHGSTTSASLSARCTSRASSHDESLRAESLDSSLTSSLNPSANASPSASLDKEDSLCSVTCISSSAPSPRGSQSSTSRTGASLVRSANAQPSSARVSKLSTHRAPASSAQSRNSIALPSCGPPRQAETTPSITNFKCMPAWSPHAPQSAGHLLPTPDSFSATNAGGAATASFEADGADGCLPSVATSSSVPGRRRVYHPPGSALYRPSIGVTIPGQASSLSDPPPPLETHADNFPMGRPVDGACLTFRDSSSRFAIAPQTFEFDMSRGNSSPNSPLARGWQPPSQNATQASRTPASSPCPTPPGYRRPMFAPTPRSASLDSSTNVVASSFNPSPIGFRMPALPATPRSVSLQ